jgi:hypothetical protein
MTRKLLRFRDAHMRSHEWTKEAPDMIGILFSLIARR